MRWILGLAVTVHFVSACTEPNPRSCADGTCTDPSLPFCDVDGALAGTPQVCIAVTCTPSEIVGCRGAEAITCNSTGNDFDLVSCPMGCNATSLTCKSCDSNSQCANPVPVCEIEAGVCVACGRDDECTSMVCDEGSCSPESSIVYASPGGSESSICSQALPCSSQRALQVALAAVPEPTIRLLPGIYATTVAISTPTTAPLRVVATGATVNGLVGVRVTAGASLWVRGITASGANQIVICGESNHPRSRLEMVDSVLFASSNGAMISAGNCTVVMSRVEMNGNDTTAGILLNSDVTFEGDRLHIHGRNEVGFATFGVRAQVRLTNSILETVYAFFATSDTQGPGSLAYFGFNTFVLKYPVNCVNSPSQFRDLLFENNILMAPDQTRVIEGTTCTFRNNLMLPEPSAPATNIVADPQFIDRAGGDLRLQPTSPAIGAASATPTIFTDHDYSNRARPQGGASDIGAHEQ